MIYRLWLNHLNVNTEWEMWKNLDNYLIEAERRMYASVNQTISGSDNGLADRLTWTKAGILLFRTSNEILIKLHTFSF